MNQESDPNYCKPEDLSTHIPDDPKDDPNHHWMLDFEMEKEFAMEEEEDKENCDPNSKEPNSKEDIENCDPNSKDDSETNPKNPPVVYNNRKYVFHRTGKNTASEANLYYRCCKFRSKSKCTARITVIKYSNGTTTIV
jgi:hypothetical protein